MDWSKPKHQLRLLNRFKAEADARRLAERDEIYASNVRRQQAWAQQQRDAEEARLSAMRRKTEADQRRRQEQAQRQQDAQAAHGRRLHELRDEVASLQRDLSSAEQRVEHGELADAVAAAGLVQVLTARLHAAQQAYALHRSQGPM